MFEMFKKKFYLFHNYFKSIRGRKLNLNSLEREWNYVSIDIKNDEKCFHLF